MYIKILKRTLIDDDKYPITHIAPFVTNDEACVVQYPVSVPYCQIVPDKVCWIVEAETIFSLN